jgi:hypothetical protein
MEKNEKPFNWMGGSPLMDQTEKQIEEGMNRPRVNNTNVTAIPSESEPTKGVQAYLPMSLYMKLNQMKYERKQTMGTLLVEAVRVFVEREL